MLTSVGLEVLQAARALWRRGKEGYAPVACGVFAAAAFLATALPFFFTAFLAADFNFRVRMAFFCIEVRFVGMVLARSRRYGTGSYKAYLKDIQSIVHLNPNALRAGNVTTCVMIKKIQTDPLRTQRRARRG
jgi:hypothetical protein